MARIFPTTVKRTTIIQGGSGPNPTDAFSVKFALPDTNTAPTDATVFAFAFPDTVAVQSETSTFVAQFLLADTSPGQTDSLFTKFTFPDTNSVSTDTVGFSFAFPETIALQADALTVGVRSDDSAPAQVDASSLFRIAGLGDTVSTATENVSLKTAFADSNAGQVETALLKFSHSDSASAPTDSASLLRVTGLGDTTSTQSDTFTAALAYTAADANTAPSDVLGLKVTFSDTNASPTDNRSATAVWEQGATTAAGAGWTTPANAQGLRDGTAVATLTDAALDQVSGTLTLDPYPDPDTTFSAWTITKVRFKVYADGTLSLATTSRLHMEYSVDGTTWTTMESIAASFNNRAAGESGRLYDRTADRAWTWANINNARFRARYVAALLVETATLKIDAVHLEVTATKSPL